MKHDGAACPALFQNAQHAENTPGKAAARPSQRGVFQNEPGAWGTRNFFAELSERAAPAELGPAHAKELQSDAFMLQGVRQVFTIFENALGWFIAPTKE